MLVNCVAYQNGLKLADIALNDINEYVHKPDCFVWVAVKDPSRSELAELQEEFGFSRVRRIKGLLCMGTAGLNGPADSNA